MSYAQKLPRVGNTITNKVKIIKILCLAVLLGVVISFATNEFVASGKAKVNRPIVILGLSKIRLNHTETVGVQVNRVIRDCLWNNSPFDVRVPANRIPKNSSYVVPYAEGDRVREMMNWAGVKVLPLTPCRAKNFGPNCYFAADGQGHFSFLISPSKITFPPFSKTVFRPEAGSNETADLICPETHGFNMIAEQAYIHRKDIYLAVACMDLPAKAQAALYLAKNGINIYAPCDRMASLLIELQEVRN